MKEDLKQIWLAVIALSVVLVMYAVGRGVSQYFFDKAEPSADSATASEVEKNFMIGCTEDGTEYEFCKCGYDLLEKRIGVDEIINESLAFNEDGYFSDKMNRELVNVSLECLN